MKVLYTNKLDDEAFHEALLDMDPWGHCMDGKFVGMLCFPEWLAEDEDNPAIFEFTVSTLIDDFIDGNQRFDNGMFCDEGEREAIEIISDLRNMIDRLEERLVITHPPEEPP